MGCGSSQEISESSKREFNTLIGKTIPKQLTKPYEPLKTNKVTHKADKTFKRSDRKGMKIVKQKAIQEEIMNKNSRQMKKDESEFILYSLDNHFVFANQSRESLMKLISTMQFRTQKEGEIIFQQGANGGLFFFLQNGLVDIIVNDVVKKTLSPGQYFGENALLYNSPRSATAKTKLDCEFWVLDRVTFKKYISEVGEAEFDENRQFIEKIQFFSFMTNNQKNAITKSLISLKYGQNDFIVKEGDQADSYYIIKKGNVEIMKNGLRINKMGPMDSFGESALYEESVRQASVRALNEVNCLALSRMNIQKILGDQIQIIIYGNTLRWAISANSTLKQLTPVQQEKIAKKAKIENVNEGDTIDLENKIIILLEGSMNNSVQKGQCIGERELFVKSQEKQNVIMKSEGVIGIIDFEIIYQVGKSQDINEIMEKANQSHEMKMKKLGAKQKSQIKFEDLIYICTIGQGQITKVYLVKHKLNYQLFILKVISKELIIERELQKSVQQIRQIYQLINYPYIQQMNRTFKDQQNIYYLNQFIQGISLYNVIRQLGILDKEQAQYYIGSMILGLEYLHSLLVIHRDLRPENLLINDKGMLIFIDLDSSKCVKNSARQLTNTIIGTPHYMAPEVIVGRGYNVYSDLWSLGVCCYEFIFGVLPFANDQLDPFEIYQLIINSVIVDVDDENYGVDFPALYDDDLGKAFLSKLFNREAEARLGSSYSELKAHPWLDELDWDKLYNCELVPPYVPDEGKLILADKIEDEFTKGLSIPIQQGENVVITKDWDGEF